MSSNTPCNNPALCGVRSHRPGTLTRCQSSQATRNDTSRLGSTPARGASGGASDPAQEANERVSRLTTNELRGKLWRGGVTPSENWHSGNLGTINVFYPGTDGSTHRVAIQYNDQEFDKSFMQEHEDFAAWLEYTSGKANLVPGDSPEEIIDNAKVMVYNGERADLQIGTEGNTKRFIEMNRERHEGGNLEAGRNLLSARICTSNGKVVTAVESSEPHQRPYVFADGHVYHYPMIRPVGPQGKDIASWITMREYEQLAKLHYQVKTAGSRERLDPDNSMTEQELTDASIEAAYALADSR